MRDKKYLVKNLGAIMGMSPTTGAVDVRSKLVREYGFTDSDFIPDSYLSERNRTVTAWFVTDDAYNRLLAMLHDETAKSTTTLVGDDDNELLKNALGTINNLKVKLSECEKEVAFARSVMVSEDCINVGMMARILFMNGVEMTERKMFQWLRENGYIEDIDRFHNIPTEKALDDGYMKFTEVTVCSGTSGRVHINFTPKITGKGQVYFTNAFGVNTEC